MCKTLILMSAFLIWSNGPHVFAQEKKPGDVATKTQSTTETEKPKTEVDRLRKLKNEVKLCLGDAFRTAVTKLSRETLKLVTRLSCLSRYAPLARAAHVSGQVVVQLLIDVDETVIDAVAVSGHSLLYGVSVEAAKASKFSVTKLAGKPVKVTGVITYNFVNK